MKRLAMRVASAATLVAVAAHAYHGGPRTVAVLGWDAAKERIYCQQVGHDESVGERSLLYYFDLRSNEPERPRVLEWSRKQPTDVEDEADSLYRTRLQRLERGLRRLPIVDEHEPSIVRGRAGRLLVLSYHGDPLELEEVQRAVLLMSDPVKLTQVLDEPWGMR